MSAVIVHRESSVARRVGAPSPRAARRTMLMAVLGLSAISAFGLMAYAYWAGNDTASSSFAKADALGQGATPNVTTPASPLVASSVGVSWAKSFLGSGADVGGYIVKRYPDSSGPAETVGANCLGTITALNCTELNVPDGTWTYTVTPVIGTNWVGTESNKSSSLRVGTTQLTITSSPVSIVAGSTSSAITVQRQDSGSNPTSVGSRTITLFSPSGAGTFRDPVTPANVITSVIIPDGASSITFKYNDTLAGTPTITASSSNVTSASQLVTVSAAAANKLSFTTPPGNGTAGNLLSPQPVVTIQDQYGNTATTATNTVSLTGATFATTPTTCTPTLASGVVTFSGCRINTAGSYTLVAGSSPSLTTASSNSFTVSSATATQLVYGTQPSSAIAGATQPDVTVLIQDAFGNLTSSTATVSVSLIPSATISGTTTQNAVAGTATFSGLSVNKAGSYVLRAAATLGSPMSVDSAPFVISPAATDHVVFTTTAPSGTTTDASTSLITVERQDVYNNPTTTSSTALTLTSNSGTGAFRNSADTSTITALTIPASASTASFRYRDTVKGSRTINVGSAYPNISQTFTIAAGAIHHLAFIQQPGGGTAGLPLSTQPIVAILDANNNVVDTALNKISLAIATGPGGVLNTSTACATGSGLSAVSGVVAFTDCRIDKAGTTYTLTASIKGPNASVTSTPVLTIAAGTGTTLVFGTVPSTVVAGNALSAVSVLINDSFGNLSTSIASITVAVNTGNPAGTLAGTKTVTAVAGTATFTTLSLDKVGTYTLLATGSSLTDSPSSSSILVTVGAASKVVFSAQPTGTAGGATMAPVVVQVQDAGGNVVTTSGSSISLAIGTNGVGRTLSGTTTATAVNGVATFSALSIDKAGSGYTLAAASSGLASATSSTFNITVGLASKVVFSTQPTGTAGGATMAPVVVQVQDAGGNVVTASNAPITISIGNNAGAGTLSGTTTLNASSGVATFSTLSINKAGSGYTLTASSGVLTSATSTAFNITVGLASKVVFSTQPTGTAGGLTMSSVVVQVQDAAGNVVTTSSDSITISFASNAGAGTLSGTTTLNASSGVATFSTLSINKAGSGYTLTASSGVLTSATSNAFNITVGLPSKVVFSSQPTNTAGGATISTVVVQVQDAGGNVVTASSAPITISIGTNGGTPAGTLSGTATVNASSGVATFSNLSIDKAGSGYALAASSGVLTPATSTTFNVNVGGASKLAFSSQPTNTVAGAIISSVVVQVQDAGGNVVTTSIAPISMAIGANGGPGGTLGGTASGIASSGIATFSTLSIDKAGTGYTLSATSSGLTLATSNAFTVTAGNPSKLAFTTQPSSTTGGATMSSVVVQVQDSLGNLVTTSSASIAMAFGANTGGGTLSGTTPVAALNGVATFNDLSINKFGTAYTLAASSSLLTPATSSSFNIAVGAASKLAISTQPTNTVAGATMASILVQVQDAGGNVVTASTASITMAIGVNPAAGTLSGTTTVSASAGVATFSTLSINKTGTGYTLTAASTPLTSATSATFNIIVGPPPTVSSPSTATPFSITNGTQSTVTITGTNFLPGTTVTVANGTGKCTGLAATFVNSTSVTVAVTAANNQTGLCNFTVLNPDGGSVTVLGGLKNV